MEQSQSHQNIHQSMMSQTSKSQSHPHQNIHQAMMSQASQPQSQHQQQQPEEVRVFMRLTKTALALNDQVLSILTGLQSHSHGKVTSIDVKRWNEWYREMSKMRNRLWNIVESEANGNFNEEIMNKIKSMQSNGSNAVEVEIIRNMFEVAQHTRDLLGDFQKHWQGNQSSEVKKFFKKSMDVMHQRAQQELASLQKISNSVTFEDVQHILSHVSNEEIPATFWIFGLVGLSLGISLYHSVLIWGDWRKRKQVWKEMCEQFMRVMAEHPSNKGYTVYGRKNAFKKKTHWLHPLNLWRIFSRALEDVKVLQDHYFSNIKQIVILAQGMYSCLVKENQPQIEILQATRNPVDLRILNSSNKYDLTYVGAIIVKILAEFNMATHGMKIVNDQGSYQKTFESFPDKLKICLKDLNQLQFLVEVNEFITEYFLMDHEIGKPWITIHSVLKKMSHYDNFLDKSKFVKHEGEMPSAARAQHVFSFIEEQQTEFLKQLNQSQKDNVIIENQPDAVQEQNDTDNKENND